MRLVKAATDAGPRVGVLRPDGMVAVSHEAAELESSLGDDGSHLQALGEGILADPAAVVALEDLDLLAPVTPVSMRDFMVFEEHVTPSWRKAGLSRGPDAWYQQPVGYFSNVATLRGPHDPVEIPGGARQLDFELEIGAVVGRSASSVTPAAAAGLIAGYLILCDWSARDVQATEMTARLGPFKGKDFASSLGPVFVTPDEIADRRHGTGYDLEMSASVNGRRYGADLWSSAYWSFEELVSFASWNARVEQGALIGSGTCQGGCILELSNRNSSAEYPWLVAGDDVRLDVETMGAIRATVHAPTRPSWPGARTSARGRALSE